MENQKKTRTLTIRLSPRLYEEIQKEAEKRYLSLSSCVNLFIQCCLSHIPHTHCPRYQRYKKLKTPDKSP